MNEPNPTLLTAASALGQNPAGATPLSGAAELMYFANAPLAHVVAYDDWRREERLRRRYVARDVPAPPPAPVQP